MKGLAKFLLAASVILMAQASYSAPNEPYHHPHCRHIHHHHLCEHTPGCYWNHDAHSCHRYQGGGNGGDCGGGGGSHHYRCYQIEHYHHCINTEGCRWDRYERRCLPNHHHH